MGAVGVGVSAFVAVRKDRPVKTQRNALEAGVLEGSNSEFAPYCSKMTQTAAVCKALTKVS